MKPNTQERTERSGVNTQSSFAHGCLASCRKLLAQIENTRAEIVAEFREGLEEHQHLLELAVNEAEALAWQTGFPQLFFPALAAEKAHTVAAWHARQHSLRRHTPPLALAG